MNGRLEALKRLVSKHDNTRRHRHLKHTALTVRAFNCNIQSQNNKNHRFAPCLTTSGNITIILNKYLEASEFKTTFKKIHGFGHQGPAAVYHAVAAMISLHSFISSKTL